MPEKIKAIDANIILRFFLNDNPEKAERCSALLQRVESGAEQVFLPDLVIADVVWTLEKFYRQPKARITNLAPDTGARQHYPSQAARNPAGSYGLVNRQV